MRGCMKQRTVAICGENTRDFLLLEEHVCTVVPDAVIVKYTKGELLVADLRENRNNFDIIFIDIDQKDGNGINLTEEIRRFNKQVPLVLISKEETYYRQAFDLFAMQYLLKPVTEKKIQQIFQMLDYSSNETDEKIVYFRYRSRIYTLKQKDIIYISSSLHTVNFHLEDGERVQCRGKLSDFEDQLKGGDLFRCHQSFYVNMKKTMGMKSDCFILADNVIPISRTYIKEAQELYQKYLNKEFPV